MAQKGGLNGNEDGIQCDDETGAAASPRRQQNPNGCRGEADARVSNAPAKRIRQVKSESAQADGPAQPTSGGVFELA